MERRTTRLDHCQFLLSSQINYTLTHFAEHSRRFSHDLANRYLAGERITPRLVWENVRGQDAFSNRFVGEWTYLLGLAAGRCRGWGAGGLMPPQPTQGFFEKGKSKEDKGLIVLGKAKSEGVEAVVRPLGETGGGTHVPQSGAPRTTAKGVIIGRNRTLLLIPVVAFLVL
jgi:hypothetical protein